MNPLNARKPRLFIGSAGESREVANKIQASLGRDGSVEVTVWDQNVFQLGDQTLTRLCELVSEFDFGVFVFAPADVAIIRKKKVSIPRDNVIFELGMYIGRLGPNRCFVVVPTGGEKLHLPTDLLGFTYGTYNPNRGDGNLVAALGPVCDQMREAIRRLGQFNPANELAVKEIVENIQNYLRAGDVTRQPSSAQKIPLTSVEKESVPEIGKEGRRNSPVARKNQKTLNQRKNRTKRT